MNRWYIDTSAAMKLLVDEVESEPLAAVIDSQAPELVACTLLETELRRASHRDPALTQTAITGFLEGVDLYELPVTIFQEAGLLPGASLRSLDALHLAAAIRIGVDQLIAYDRRMADAARGLGMTVSAPA